MIEDIDYSELDPGIRRTVQYLRRLGFETTDSGDGVAKEGEDKDSVSPPHVVIYTRPADLVTESDRLKTILENRGITILPYGVHEYLKVESPAGSVEIQGSYDPALEEHGILIITGLNDALLENTGGIPTATSN